MANHGVYVYEIDTGVSTPVVAKTGIPFVIGRAPVQAAETPAAVGVPVLCTSWAEAVKKLGYSEDWGNYTLCEFMYSHFKLYGCQPVIFCNLLDPADMKSAVAAADKAVVDHKIMLPIAAINSAALVVKAAGGGGSAYVKDTDYAVYYDGENCVIELLSGGGAYSATSLNVAYNEVTPDSVNAAAVAMGMEAIEECLTTVSLVPDIICAPGFSDTTTVAAVMATKAAGINGLFRAKAIIDISTAAAGGADSYDEVVALKNTNNFVDENQIVCWPLLTLGDMVFHTGTQLAGLMASVDTLNGGCPYESPSNKGFKCDGMTVEAGTPLSITKAQADILNAGGIVTALNFLGGLVAWGNTTACYPVNTDVKDYFIPVSRMFDWVGNSLILTFWNKLDKPMTRRHVDSILDTANIWLNGLVGMGYLYGARVEMLAEENPLTDLMAGIIRLHVYMTPPAPNQEIDFVLEYNAEFVTAALG